MKYNNVDLDSCYVLHQTAYRDSSALVDVFSRQHGRIGLVARGIKSSKSKMRGLLQPFSPSLISWGGRGDLQTLKTVEAHGLATVLPHRWVMSGFYLNELLLRLTTRHDPHIDLYDHYECTLKLLGHLASCEKSDEVQNEHQRVLRLFEKNLLIELGYGLMLDYDAESGKPIENDEYYQYYLEKGPVLVSADVTTNGSALVVKGASLLSLAQDKLDDADSLQETKRLMRTILSSYLGHKPLHSREMFQQTIQFEKNRPDQRVSQGVIDE